MKEYLLSKKIRKADLIILAIALISLFLGFHFRTTFDDAVVKTTDLSLGYIARESNDRFYVVDQGHARLISFDKDANTIFELIDPSDNGESILYIDDVHVDDSSVYLSASEWDGMLLCKEVILKYDLNGELQEVIAQNDYDIHGDTTNKHRFYGICNNNGKILFAECLKDSIVLHTLSDGNDSTATIQYPNAFNAVSDIVYDGATPIIMNKNGTIERFNNLSKGELVYSTSWTNENKRIPYRMSVKDGEVYFTDIRNQEVVKADTASQSGEVAYSGTDSQTVTFSNSGKDMLLVGGNGLTVTGENNTEYLSLNKTKEQITSQAIFIGASIVFAMLGLFIIFRLIMVLSGIKFDQTKIASFSIVALVAIICFVISFILINSFRVSYREKIQEQLQSTALIVSSGISEEDINNINDASDFNNESYRNICVLMERTFPLDVDFYHTTYCNILRMDEKGAGSGIAYLDQSIGVYFPLDEIETDEVRRVYENGEPVWNSEIEDVSGTYISVKVPIFNSANKVVGAVAVGADTYVVDEMIASMQSRVLFSIVVILMILWIISTESISLVNNRVDYVKKKAEIGDKAVPMHLLRLLIFIVFAAFNMVSSFLPVYILRRCDLFGEGSRELLASLPMTINIFVMGIMSLFCANAIRKFGIRKIIMVSTLFSLCGNLILLIVPGYFSIIIGLLFDGIGVGTISNAIYVMLTYLTDEEERQNGFTVYNAASLSGINFGMILGGLLATGVSQRFVFLVVAIFWLILLFLGTYIANKLSAITPEVEDEFDMNERIGAHRFASNKTILSFIVLMQNPYIVFNSFVFYFVPIFCESIGYNETIVSVFLMIYSEVAVILGEVMTEKTNKIFGNYAMYLALGLNILAVAVFVMERNVTGLIMALIILGIAASFGKPSQQTYFLSRKITKEYGEDKAMGIYNFSENIGESLGPMVFARLVGASFLNFATFLGTIAGLGTLHFVLNRKELKENG